MLADYRGPLAVSTIQDLSALQADVHRLPEILQEVSPEEVRHKQVALSHIWRRFMYTDYPFFDKGLARHKDSEKWQRDLDAAQWPQPSPPAAYHGQYGRDDAFGTIVQWLYHRMQQHTSSSGP